MLFFFQAEDGIRDWSVTGVQTCALPISLARTIDQSANGLPADRIQAATIFPTTSAADSVCGNFADGSTDAYVIHVAERSEERRVGKESRRGRAREREKKQQQGKHSAASR